MLPMFVQRSNHALLHRIHQAVIFEEFAGILHLQFNRIVRHHRLYVLSQLCDVTCKETSSVTDKNVIVQFSQKYTIVTILHVNVSLASFHWKTFPGNSERLAFPSERTKDLFRQRPRRHDVALRRPICFGGG